MRTLVDTHAFLWWIAGDERMSRHSREIFAGSSNLLMSVASIWEILIKVQIGKLNLPRPAGPFVISELAENRIEILPIKLDHLLVFEQLPMHHRDPFDRMLIAQGIKENLPIITPDPLFGRYPVRIIW